MHRGSLARIPQATRLPNLQVQYAYLPLPVETRVGPNEHRISLKQVIPFPTKLFAKDSAARAGARRSEALHDGRVRDEITKLKVAYADLRYFERALEILEQNEAIANTIAQLGATRGAAGEGVLFDIARAQSQLAQLSYDRVTLSERRDIVAAKINGLLGRVASAPLHAAPLPLQGIDVSEEALLARALEYEQELRALDAVIEREEALADLASAAWMPDISVGVQYMLQSPSQMNPAPPDSGEDAVAVTIGLSLPLSFHANAGVSDEANARLSAAILAKESHLYGLQPRLREVLFAARNAERLRLLYDETLLPHAFAALETAEQEAQQSSAQYADLLEARAAFYSFSLARERAVSDQFQAIARVERMIGATLSGAADEGTTPTLEEVSP